MNLRNIQLAAITMSVISSAALAQTTFPEIEPNTNKAEADAAGVITLVAGDSITGTTTGTTATALSTLVASVDQFRIKTGALPLGIYKHELVITTTGTAGHTGTIRGLNQTGTVGVGGIAGTTDAAVQTSSTTHTPARKNTWYAFGKQEELYYRVTGTATTTSPYVSTLTTTPVTATVIAPSFEAANPITITTIGQTTADTMIHVYDGSFNAIPGASNDDEGPVGPTLQSRIIRTFAPGTYYLNVSSSNTAWNFVAPNDEDFFSNLMDFPNLIVRTSTTITALDWDFKITGSNGSFSQTNQLAAGPGFEQTWFQFTVANGAPVIIPPAPANDNCAAAITIGTGGTLTGTTAGASNDGSATCDPGVGTAKDVWYFYTNTTAFGRLLDVSTCGTTAIDTCISVIAGCGGAELACNDDCGGAPCAATASCLTGVVVNAGQTVLIRVSDKGLSPIQQGDFTLVTATAIIPPPPPSNDACATPVSIAGPGTYPIDNLGATTGVEGQTEAICQFAVGTTAINKDMWYSYVPTTNGSLTVSTCGLIATGPTQDSKIAIYSLPGCPAAGTATACNDDATCTGFSGLNATVTTPAVCGTTYMIQIGAYLATGNISGSFSVTETGGTSCATPVTYYCKGDGTATACPCGNVGATGNGCANSINANGGNVAASGIASVSGDTWLLSATGVPNGPGLYFQGTTQLNGGNGVVFGDGLRCTGGSVIRLGIVTAASNASTYPSPNPPAANQIPISLKGLIIAGDIRNYQLWYRDSGVFCNTQVFNLTNAVNVTWTP